MKQLIDFIVEQNNSNFKGQQELASYIGEVVLKEHKENITLYQKDLSHIDYIYFFDKINITCKFNSKQLKGISQSIYSGNDLNKEIDPIKKLYKEYNFNEDTQNLYDFNLELEIPKNVNITALKGRISHELNHIYTYWNIVHDDFYEHSENISVPAEYHNRLHEWADKIYSKILKAAGSFIDIRMICGSLLYSLTTYERNAFLCEINMYLFDNRTNLNNIDKVLSSCNQYNIYKIETPKILKQISNWNQNDKDLLVKTYNDIYKTNKNFNQIFKILNHKLKITLEKIDKNIKNLSEMYSHMNEHVLSYPLEVSYDRKEFMMKNFITYF